MPDRGFMILSVLPHPAFRLGRLLGGTLAGSVLVAAGLLTAYMAIATPTMTGLVPDAAGRQPFIGLGIWSFALIAGGSLLVSGTDRLARIVAAFRHRHANGGPAARALALRPDGVVVLNGFVPGDGRPIAEIVIGAFGVVVIHELPGSGRVRRGPRGWEARSGDGWHPMDDPLEAAARDAERVRHWLGTSDLDFVVRTYAAVVVRDRTFERTPTCAVVTPSQLAAWVASLPRQRTLTVGRRGRLVTLAQAPAAGAAGRTAASRGRGW
jgi:hypothetical protein